MEGACGDHTTKQHCCFYSTSCVLFNFHSFQLFILFIISVIALAAPVQDEAFALWRSQWATAYEAGSPSASVIDGIANSWWLVNIVDNDYVRGDIFAIVKQVRGFLCSNPWLVFVSRVCPTRCIYLSMCRNILELLVFWLLTLTDY
jgi:hypothetical protein